MNPPCLPACLLGEMALLDADLSILLQMSFAAFHLQRIRSSFPLRCVRSGSSSSGIGSSSSSSSSSSSTADGGDGDGDGEAAEAATGACVDTSSETNGAVVMIVGDYFMSPDSGQWEVGG